MFWILTTQLDPFYLSSISNSIQDFCPVLCLTTEQISFLVHILGETMTLKNHSEIYWLFNWTLKLNAKKRWNGTTDSLIQDLFCHLKRRPKHQRHLLLNWRINILFPCFSGRQCCDNSYQEIWHRKSINGVFPANRKSTNRGEFYKDI